MKRARTGLTWPKGGAPIKSSHATIPKLQTSAAPPYADRVITSGAIQKGEPMKVSRWPRVAESWAAAPKSASFTQPARLTSLGGGFPTHTREDEENI